MSRKWLYRSVAITTLFTLVSGSWWVWKVSSPRMKEYILKDSGGKGTPAPTGIRFMYPAGFQVQEDGGFMRKNVVRLIHIPPVGFAAWFDDRLHNGELSALEKSTIVLSYNADKGSSSESVERVMSDWIAHSGGKTRKVRYRLGPGVVYEEPSKTNDTLRFWWIFPELSQTTGAVRSSNSEVIILYESAKHVEPQIHRVVEDLMSNMQIVPLNR